MIQRVQTIFLFLLSICMFMMLFFPIWEKLSIDQQEKVALNAFYMVQYTIDSDAENPGYQLLAETGTYFIAILSAIAGLVALFSIFQYKNRLTQIKLGFLNTLLIAATLGVSIYYMFQGENLFNPEVRGDYKVGFFLPALALLLNSLANRFIRRDEKLVRSVDRIR